MMKDDLAILIKFLQENPQGDLYELFFDRLYRAGISTIRQPDLYPSMDKNPFTYGPDGEILTCGITYFTPEQFQFELVQVASTNSIRTALPNARATRAMTPRYSLVVPFYNEAGNILPLIESAVVVLDSIGHDYEILLVNDGSTDATADEIAACLVRWPRCRALHQPCNLGQATALLDGLRAAHGEIILTMDGDGQNDPRDFPLLLAPVEAGTLDVA